MIITSGRVYGRPVHKVKFISEDWDSGLAKDAIEYIKSLKGNYGYMAETKEWWIRQVMADRSAVDIKPLHQLKDLYIKMEDQSKQELIEADKEVEDFLNRIDELADEERTYL